MPASRDRHHAEEPAASHALGDHALGSHTLGPHVVGRRVVVRRIVPGETGPTGGPAFTDTLGVCVQWGEGTCAVQREDGTTAVIAIADIVSGKPVPPRPSVRHRASAREVEEHSFVLWPQMTVERLGDWALRVAPRSDGRVLRRANSALAMGDPGCSSAAAAAAVLDFYAAHRQPALAQVELGSDTEAALLELGWRPLAGGDAHCQLASVARALRTVRARVAATAHPDSGPARWTEEGPRLEVELVDRSGAGTAMGRAALDGDWLGLHSLHVDPGHRGAELAHRVLAELLDWGASRGATTAWLHVEVDNAAALALYGGVGFATHHSFRYLTEPDPGSTRT